MIRRSTAFAVQQQLISCKSRSQHVLTMWRCGCEAIGCSSTLLKPKFSGVRQAEDNIRFHRFLYELEITWSYRHFCQGPWHSSRHKCHHQLSHRQDCVKLLLCTTPAPKHPSVRHQTSPAVAGGVVGTFTLGLLQRIDRWSAQHSS